MILELYLRLRAAAEGRRERRSYASPHLRSTHQLVGTGSLLNTHGTRVAVSRRVLEICIFSRCTRNSQLGESGQERRQVLGRSPWAPGGYSRLTGTDGEMSGEVGVLAGGWSVGQTDRSLLVFP